jgi:hypothetical protein
MRATLLALALLSTLVFPAVAQQQGANCRSLDQAISEARDQYGEVLAMRGISSGGYMLMMFANPDGSTWTLLGLLKDGQTACTLDAGEGLQFIKPGDQPVPEQGS